MSNLLLYPAAGTLHSHLTQNPIDLSDAKYKGSKYNRDLLLAFFADILRQNPQVLTFSFHKAGTSAGIMIVFTSGEIYKLPFHLMPRFKYAEIGNDYKNLSYREYLQGMLAQETSMYRVDYDHFGGFVW